MKTYSETCHIAPFDWNAALQDPSVFTDGFLKEKAESWVTCACGNQCDAIPRHENSGQPIDHRLAVLGRAFAGDVEYHDWQNARKTLRKIEERSKELLASLRPTDAASAGA